MGAAARKLLAAATGGVFDPLSIGWHSAFWAEGTDFVAQGYSDTDSVTTWPNETGESDATEATNPPTYDAADATLSNRPSVSFDGTNDYLQTANFTAAPDYTSGLTYVAIVSPNSFTGSFDIYVDGNGATVDSAERNVLGWTSTNDDWFMSAGALRGGGTPTTGGHLLAAYFSDSNSDYLEADGATVHSGAGAGSGQVLGLTLAARCDVADHWSNCQIAFVGLYEGDVTADGSWAAFQSWVSDHYGITIA